MTMSETRKYSRSRAVTPDTHPVPAAVSQANRVAQARGEALPGEVRHGMEARFGADFSKVRIHADRPAAEAAEGLNARALTLGRHIAFNSGEYAPTRPAGQRLLAHELAHVVQQQGQAARGTAPFSRDAADERQAERAADSVVGARSVGGIAARGGLRIQADDKAPKDKEAGAEAKAAAPARVTFVLRAPDDAYTQDVVDYVEKTLGEKVVRVNNLDEAADYLAAQQKAGGGKVASVRIIGHGSTTGGIKMTPGGETDRRFVSAEELEKMAADKKLKAKASGAMADGATVEFWGCYIGANPRSTQAVSDIFGADVKAIDQTLRTTHDSFARPADKGEAGEKVKGQKGAWVEVTSTAEIDDRVKAGNKQLGESFNRWLLAQAGPLEAGGDLPPQPDDKARIAAMRELFDRSGGKIKRLEIKTDKGTTRRSDGKKWLDHWKTTKVK